METKHLSYFKVENFKRFSNLEINEIGQFNLIVGDNNVGKTTLLEALLVDDDKTKLLVNLYQCLVGKKIVVYQNTDQDFLDLDFFIKDKTKPMTFSYAYENVMHSVSLQRKSISEVDRSSSTTLTDFLIAQVANNRLLQRGIIEFTIDDEISYELMSLPKYELSLFYMPYVSFGALYGGDLVTFFSQLSINNAKLESIKKEFSYFVPSLLSIEINNALVPNLPSIAIRETDKDLMLLSQYGDGTNKLFRYLLELELCENKRLMIDEIDAGIHYSRMKSFVKNILQIAKNKNVQIFATTHSKELIQCYSDALKELGFEKDGRIIKIAETKTGIKTYTSNFEQFENALIAESEIR